VYSTVQFTVGPCNSTAIYNDINHTLIAAMNSLHVGAARSLALKTLLLQSWIRPMQADRRESPNRYEAKLPLAYFERDRQKKHLYPLRHFPSDHPPGIKSQGCAHGEKHSQMDLAFYRSCDWHFTSWGLGCFMKKNFGCDSRMAPYSLYSALLLTRAV
jgi:hypothetical protein